jgi:hypothetical protein
MSFDVQTMPVRRWLGEADGRDGGVTLTQVRSLLGVSHTG